MNVPRLLPLIGVAVIGVMAINLLGGAKDVSQMLSAAGAYAEGVTAPDKTKAKTSKAAKDAPADTATATTAPAAAAPASAGVCAPGAADLAKSAGLSYGELQVLQNLQARRGEIDARSKDVDTQAQLLAVAETKLDAKLKAMADLKGQIEALMGQADQKTQGEVDRLTVVYSKMKPADAAAVMTLLDDKVRVPVAAAMKPAILSAILAKMAPPDAKKLTELLAHRFAPVQQLADAARAPPPADPAKPDPAKPDPKAKPVQTAKADPKPKAKTVAPDPDDANVDDGADVAPARKAHPKPKQVAKHVPPKKPPVHTPNARKPVEEAKVSPGPHPYSEVKDPAPKPAAKPVAATATAPAKT